ncbi:hypothetical protein LTR15_009482 [Elasticomyces elasticus]|nr:hypothetical protein LTR15_009482 [Elasticomyces elasticus]
MAEFGIVGTGVGIASLGIQVCQGLVWYYNGWKDCPEDVQRAVAVIESLSRTLEFFEPILADQDLDADIKQRVNECVTACLDGIENLNTERKKFEDPSSIKRELRRFTYPFKKSTLLKLQEIAGELLGQLSFAVQILDLSQGQRMHGQAQIALQGARAEIREISRNVDTVCDAILDMHTRQLALVDTNQEQNQVLTQGLRAVLSEATSAARDARQLLSEVEAEKLRAILTSLKAPDVTFDHDLACRRHHDKTGQWLLDSPKYNAWKDGTASRLWVYGKVGCGKTVLSSTIIEDMRSYCQDHAECSLAYFYFSFLDNRKQSWEALLRSLVMQLSQGRPPVKRLTEAFDREFGQGLTLADLSLALTQILERSSEEGESVFVVIDGLDECPDELDGRVEVQEAVCRLSKHFDHLRILITSRNYADIDRFMRHRWEASALHILPGCVNADIKLFVLDQLTTNPAFTSIGEDSRAMIVDSLAESPGGMFQWAALHLEELRKMRVKTHPRIEKALKNLPQTLTATYERMLSDVPDDCVVQAARCLSWLALAPRMMTAEEVAESMCIDLDGPSLVDESDKVALNDMFAILGGLVVALERKTGNCSRCKVPLIGTWFSCQICEMKDCALCEACQTEDGHCGNAEHPPVVRRDTRTIQLAHASVTECLFRDGTPDARVRPFLMNQARGRCALSRASLTYVQQRLLARDTDSEEPRRLMYRYPLLKLTSSIWYLMRTDKLCECLDEERHVELEKTFFGTKGHLCDWLMLDQEMAIASAQMWLEGNVDPESHLLHMACRLGLLSFVVHLLEQGANPNACTSLGITPLYVAASIGYDNIVRVLLEHRAVIDQSDDNGITPLHRAVVFGRYETVELLLIEGASVSAAARLMITPLHLASHWKSPHIMALLLAYGAPVDAALDGGETPLSLVASSGDSLISHLVSLIDLTWYEYVRSRNYRRRTVEARTECFRLLLQHGANPNAWQEKGRTVLHRASKRGHALLVRLLLEFGAEVNEGTEEDGYTALQLASAHGHEEVVAVLLEHGALIDLQNFSETTALEAAVVCGQHSVVRMLLAHGADVNSSASGVLHALSWLYDDRRAKSSKLESGIVPSGSTVSMPPTQSYEAVMGVLLAQSGLDVNRPLYNSMTLLTTASAGDYESPEFVTQVLELLPHLEVKDDLGWTALLWATNRSRVRVAEILIAHGANVNIVAWLHNEHDVRVKRSMLDHAEYWRRECIVKLLRANGAKRLVEMNDDERRVELPRSASDMRVRRGSWPLTLHFEPSDLDHLAQMVARRPKFYSRRWVPALRRSLSV